jgi:hypothetical protein
MELRRPSAIELGGCASVRERRVATSSDDWYEDVDDVVTAVILERRPRAVGIGPLREPARSRPDLLVNTRRLTV